MKRSFSIFKRDNIFFFIFLFWYIFKIAFYQYVRFSQSYIFSRLAEFMAVGFMCYCIGDILKIQKYRLISLITIEVIITFFISIIYWGASPFYAIQAQGSSIGLLYVVVFFALRKWNVSPKVVQNVLITLAVIYLLCWIYSLYKMPEMVFGIDRDDKYGEITERGFYRLFIPGNVSAVLSFYFLGAFLYKQKKWGLYLAFLMLLIVVLHVGRQMIIWTIIISAIMIFMVYRKKIMHLIIAIFVGYCGLLYIADKIPAVSSMMEMSKDQGENIDDDIRTKAVNYFVYEYPHNIVTTLFGNGAPVRDTELYKIDQIGNMHGYYHTDVGFFSMFCNYGIVTVILFGLLLVRVAKLKVEQEYRYLKYYIFYIYGTYLMSQSLTISIFTFMMAYYILETSAYKLKNKYFDKM